MSKKILLIPSKVSMPKLRLFCFPYAGGTIGTYLSWVKKLDPNVELVLIQPPGRGVRFSERPHSSMSGIIGELLQHVTFITDIPYVIFGHSLGCRVAFELCKQLKELGHKLPSYLVASGSRAPHISYEQKLIYNLPDNLLIKELESLNGTPKEILADKELMELLLPALRADFKIADTYSATKTPMPFPIHVLYGTDDNSIKDSQIAAWNDLTQCDCSIAKINGDHFFVDKSKEQVFFEVSKILRRTLSDVDLSTSPSKTWPK